MKFLEKEEDSLDFCDVMIHEALLLSIYIGMVQNQKKASMVRTLKQSNQILLLNDGTIFGDIDYIYVTLRVYLMSIG